MSVEWNHGNDQQLVRLDEEHRELLYARQTLDELIANPAHSYVSVAVLFLSISDYLRKHLEQEELLMRFEFYPETQPQAYSQHLTSHQTIVQQLNILHDCFLTASHDSYLNVAQEMSALLVSIEEHIQSIDQ